MAEKIYVLVLLFLSISVSSANDLAEQKIACDSLGSILSDLSKEFVKDNIKSDFKNIGNIYDQTLALNCDCRLQAMNLLGYHYYNQSDLVKAKKLLLDAEKLFIEYTIFDQEYILNQNYLGLINILEGNYSNASYHFMRCKKKSEAIKDTTLLTQSFLQLGLAYLEMNDLDKSAIYYQKCLDFNKYIGNDEFEGYTYQNLARIYLLKGETKKALAYTDKAYAVWDKNNFTKGKYYLAPLYAQIFAFDGANEKAIIAIENALKLSEESDIKINLDELYLKLGNLYYLTGNFEKASDAYEGALKYGIRYTKSEENELVSRLVEIHSENSNMDGLKRTIHSVMESNKRAKALQKLQADELLNSDTYLDDKVLENKQLKQSFLYEEVKLERMTFIIAILSTLLLFFLYVSNAKNNESKKRKLLIDKIELQKNELTNANVELSNLALTIASQVKELESKNLELQNFAYAASHDLKAPIRTIISFTKLLRKKLPDMNEEVDELLTFIETGGRSMNELVTDLLAYAKLDANSTEFKEKKVLVLLHDVLANINALVEDKKATININNSVDTIIVDQIKIKQALMNLITNALKYAKPDVPPIVDIDVMEEAGNYKFMIKDNGLGIEEDAQERIFDMFHRLVGQEIEGTGIGLATCKKVVAIHNGKIWVESVVGEGSTFIFTIPIINHPVKETHLSDQVLEETLA